MLDDPPSKRAGAFVAAAIGLALVGEGGRRAFAKLGNRGRMARAEGKIVGWVERTIKGNDPEQDRTTYDARVRFRPKAGPDVTFVSDYTIYLSKPPTGGRVMVEYQPGRPKEARVVQAFVEWARIALFVTFGLLGLAVAAGLLWDSFHPESPTPGGPA